jgi:hypothetical protein
LRFSAVTSQGDDGIGRRLRLGRLWVRHRVDNPGAIHRNDLQLLDAVGEAEQDVRERVA